VSENKTSAKGAYMKTAEQLRDELAQVFADLKAGTIKHADAAEFANIAGKIISSAKTQIEYYALRKQAPTIEFLESSKGLKNAGIPTKKRARSKAA
jgi:hypothetical protein